MGKLHLSKVGNAYMYRRRVPAPHVKLLGLREWRHYLGPIGHKEAVAAAHVWDVEYDQLIEKLEAIPAEHRKGYEAGEGAAFDYEKYAAIQRVKDVRKAKQAKQADQLATLPSPPKAAVAPPKGAGLRDLVDLWVRVRRPRAPGSIKAVKVVVDRFIKVVGDIDPRHVAAAHARQFRDHVEGQGLGMSWKRQNFGNMANLMGLATSEGLVDVNPFAGIQLHSPEHRGFDVGRKGFTGDQVKVILSTRTNVLPDRLMILKILAYHGARSGEIAQMRPGDVDVDDGVPVLHLRDEAGSVKNQFSHRTVPVHPECMDVVDFAAAALARGDRLLFTSLLGAEYPGPAFQAWGSRFLRQTCGITDKRLTVHSLRHTWATCSRSIGMPDPVAFAIQGHSLQAGEHGRYGMVPMKLKAEWIAKIDPLASR